MSRFRLYSFPIVLGLTTLVLLWALPTDAYASTAIVTFKTDNEHLFRKHKSHMDEFGSVAERAHHIHSLLVDHAATTHAELLEELSIFPNIKTESLWVCNSVLVHNCSKPMLRFMNSMPFVVEAREERVLPLPQFTAEKLKLVHIQETQWGVEKIGAPELWGKSTANNGKGILVASIDTGVRGTHEALKSNFVGLHGWLDAIDGKSKPHDDVGHGTHTMGTIAGTARGIGVAPGAKWLSCRGCSPKGCPESALLKCGQFVACPSGMENKCRGTPHIVSNSWGGGQGEKWYNDVIKVWHASGIIPVFSNGNSGPGCKTANSPADQDVIAVGATDVNDTIASFSSIGPSVEGIRKPDISAPGVKIVSSYFNGDQAYSSLSGTSMACPHTAGAIALLLAQNPDLAYDEVKRLLDSGVETASLQTKNSCETVSKFPNNVYGSGRLNVLTSSTKLQQDKRACASSTAAKRRKAHRQHFSFANANSDGFATNNYDQLPYGRAAVQMPMQRSRFQGIAPFAIPAHQEQL